MKVKELIQKLQQYDGECRIVYEDDHGYDQNISVSLRLAKEWSCVVLRSFDFDKETLERLNESSADTWRRMTVEEREKMMDSYKK